MPALLDQVVAIEGALERGGIPHAFGGALALAFHIEEPRATRDIDVNVFVEPDRARAVFDALPAGVAWHEDDVRRVVDQGQVRLFWAETPVDLFFSTHVFHDEASIHVERVPLDGTTIPILAATELVVFKAFFDRTKDWADIEAMIDARDADVHRALGWLVDLLGADDHRVERLQTLLAKERPDEEPRFEP
ncbi:MAG TPA: hypothetical protein VMQ81_04435 [Acidimicrobiia bacterium]|nr:hypothetical protein [Acidimicrobiia bacterium]